MYAKIIKSKVLTNQHQSDSTKIGTYLGDSKALNKADSGRMPVMH